MLREYKGFINCMLDFNKKKDYLNGQEKINNKLTIN